MRFNKKKAITITKPKSYDLAPPNTIYLLSYPRSGNTWIKILIQETLKLENSRLLENKSTNPIKYWVPDCHSDRDIEDIGNNELWSGIIKTHYHEIGRSNKFIYIFRRPADSLLSYLKFHKLQGYKGYDFPYHFQDIYKFSLEIRKLHSLAISYLKKKPSLCLPISYENMHKSQFKVLLKILDFIGVVNCDHNILQKAINYSSLENMKRLPQFVNYKNHGESFLGSGKVNSGVNSFSLFQHIIISIMTSSKYRKLIALEKSFDSDSKI
jgi:hypothetical protein